MSTQSTLTTAPLQLDHPSAIDQPSQPHAAIPVAASRTSPPKGAGFWQKLPLPIIGLSPMDGVTDHPFRFIQKKYGQPAVTYTEFSSAEGICHGATTFAKELLFDVSQRPIVAQLFGTEPTCFYQAAMVCCELGFDGIDINMGCPAKNVAHRGAGAGLIKTPSLAQDIIAAVQRAVVDWSNGATLDHCNDLTEKIRAMVRQRRQSPSLTESPWHPQATRPVLPVSVKTRLGYDQPIVEQWLPALLEMEPSAIVLHGRTLTQHYAGSADWEQIGRAAALARPTPTLLLGNGDLPSKQTALAKIKAYKLDGALLGRATMGNPFVFLDEPPTQPTLASIALEHAQLYEATMQQFGKYSFLPMRKHLGWYIRGVHDASAIRTQLFAAASAAEVESTLRQFQLLPG